MGKKIGEFQRQVPHRSEPRLFEEEKVTRKGKGKQVEKMKSQNFEVSILRVWLMNEQM